MPHEHLPGPRARLRDRAMDTVAARDPRLQVGNGRPNVSAIARALKTTPGSMNKMAKGTLPLNLEVFTALAVHFGSWQDAIELVCLVDEDGNPIELDICAGGCGCSASPTPVGV